MPWPLKIKLFVLVCCTKNLTHSFSVHICWDTTHATVQVAEHIHVEGPAASMNTLEWHRVAHTAHLHHVVCNAR